MTQSVPNPAAASPHANRTSHSPASRVSHVSLNGGWHLSYGPEPMSGPMSPDDPARTALTTIPANVPGNVELDLLAAGKIADPSIGTNAYQLRPYETYTWWYSRSFATPSAAPGERVELIFEGVDTLATYWLNGQELGSTSNMLIPHHFDVTDCLTPAGRDNQLLIRIDSAVLTSRQYQPTVIENALDALNYQSLSIRKAAHMYGWDILPRIVSAGLWRGVHLVIRPPTGFRDIHVATRSVDPEHNSARLLIDWDIHTDRRDPEGITARFTLADPSDGRVLHAFDATVLSTHDRRVVSIENVEFWWPRGSGAAKLYELRCELLDADATVLDLRQIPVGVRTIELRRTDLTTPQGDGEFVFIVNGHKIFARGTNWVPLDSLHSRDPQHLPGMIDMLVDLNCNMVRCWGGNVYEDDEFFNLCDQRGIMVWQDFAMGCAVYPQEDDFARQIRDEADAIIQKLRNHPSLALWAGNNEGDAFFEWASGINPNTDRLSRKVLPDAVRRLDPLRAYLPCSPYFPPAYFEQSRPDSDVLPEQHLWGSRDDFKSPFYTTHAAHFASEIGYHGCPDRATLEQMLDPEFVWPWHDNPQWLAKAVRPHPLVTRYDYRIPLMANQIRVLFPEIPDNLDDFVLASQISQAEALKFFIEQFRSGKWRRTGILWWNLRDGWPVISDAIVDYYGRRKLAYNFVKRVQSDVCVMIGEPANASHAVIAVNDGIHRGQLAVTIRDADTDAILLQTTVNLEPNCPAIPIGELSASSSPAMWLIQWSFNGNDDGNHYLAGPRPFDLPTYRRWLKLM